MSRLGWMLVFASAIFTVAANMLMRYGLGRAGGFTPSLAQVPSALFRLMLQPHFFTGIVFYALAAVVWFRVIASEPLTTAYPILVSITFVFVSLGAVYWFGEHMSARKIAALALMLAGIALMSKG